MSDESTHEAPLEGAEEVPAAGAFSPATWRRKLALALAAVLAVALQSIGNRAAMMGAVLAVLSPLSIVAAREAGPGAPLELVAALLVLVAVRPPASTASCQL